MKIFYPYKMTLNSYQQLRADSYDILRSKRKAQKYYSYGVYSADASINRYKKYKKEHLLSVARALIDGKLNMRSPRIKEHRELSIGTSYITESGKGRPYNKKEYIESLKRSKIGKELGFS